MAQPTRDIFVHIIRTFVLVAVLTAILWGLFYACFFFRLPIPIVVGVIVLYMAAIVFGTARWHAYWAPIAKQVARIPWQRDDGVAMETIIEVAIVHRGPAWGTYRASIYQQEPRKRLKRIMIGDEVKFLGMHGARLWFYLADKFHARRDGLVAMNPQTGEWVYHVPQAELEFVDRVANRRGVIDVLHRGAAKRIDLNDEAPVR